MEALEGLSITIDGRSTAGGVAAEGVADVWTVSQK
jgi:hypothetical protein